MTIDKALGQNQAAKSFHGSRKSKPRPVPWARVRSGVRARVNTNAKPKILADFTCKVVLPARQKEKYPTSLLADLTGKGDHVGGFGNWQDPPC